MNAMFDESSCSLIRAKPKMLLEVFHHIHDTFEIVMAATQQGFSVATAFTAEHLVDGKRQLSTEIAVNTSEFDIYEYRSQNEKEEFKYCHKEATAFLQFCEATDQSDIDLFFSHSGSAIKYCCHLENYLKINLIVATTLAKQQSQPPKERAPPEALPNDSAIVNNPYSAQSNASSKNSKEGTNRKKKFMDEYNEDD